MANAKVLVVLSGEGESHAMDTNCLPIVHLEHALHEPHRPVPERLDPDPLGTMVDPLNKDHGQPEHLSLWGKREVANGDGCLQDWPPGLALVLDELAEELMILAYRSSQLTATVIAPAISGDLSRIFEISEVVRERTLEDDGPMKTVNRFALVVRPAGPYIEWAAKTFGETEAQVSEELGQGEPSIYLLPESNAADLDHPGVLKAHWRAIFKEELEGWCTDKKSWPKNLSEVLFRAWFQLDYCTMIYDRGKEPLILEE